MTCTSCSTTWITSGKCVNLEILRVKKITGRKCPIILYLEDIPKNCYAQETELQEIAMIQTKQTTSLIDMEFSKKTT